MSLVRIVEVDGNNFSGRSAGTIERCHAICLLKCSERLLSPLTIIVGSLVANRYTHCAEFHCFKVKNGGGNFTPRCCYPQAVTTATV